MYGYFRGAGEGVMTDAQVLRKASLLPVQLQLRIERLKFAARLRSSDGWWRMKTVVTQDTWHGLLRQDLLMMHKELGAMPPYSCQPEEWHKLWADFPGAWKLLVRRFAQRLQESCCSSQDGDIADAGQLAHVPSDLDGVHTRTNCGTQFASNCGLAVHVARVHGVRRLVPSYAGRDGICSSCKRGFHTRLRLVHHRSYSSPRCLEWCILDSEPLTDQDREVLDREDADQRRKDKREGRSFLATAVPFVFGKLTPPVLGHSRLFRPVGSCMLPLQCTVLCFLHCV